MIRVPPAIVGIVPTTRYRSCHQFRSSCIQRLRTQRRRLVQIFLHAPRARNVPFAHGLASCQRSQMRFIKDERASRYMESLSIRINQHHHFRRHSSSGLRVFGPQSLVHTRRPCHLEAARYQQRCRRRDHPTKESSSTGVRILIQPALQSVTESPRHLDHALVSVQFDHIARPGKNGTTTLASAKVFFHGSASLGLQFAIQIV